MALVRKLKTGGKKFIFEGVGEWDADAIARTLRADLENEANRLQLNGANREDFINSGNKLIQLIEDGKASLDSSGSIILDGKYDDLNNTYTLELIKQLKDDNKVGRGADVYEGTHLKSHGIFTTDKTEQFREHNHVLGQLASWSKRIAKSFDIQETNNTGTDSKKDLFKIGSYITRHALLLKGYDYSNEDAKKFSSDFENLYTIKGNPEKTQISRKDYIKGLLDYMISNPDFDKYDMGSRYTSDNLVAQLKELRKLLDNDNVDWLKFFLDFSNLGLGDLSTFLYGSTKVRGAKDDEEEDDDSTLSPYELDKAKLQASTEFLNYRPEVQNVILKELEAYHNTKGNNLLIDAYNRELNAYVDNEWKKYLAESVALLPKVLLWNTKYNPITWDKNGFLNSGVPKNLTTYTGYLLEALNTLETNGNIRDKKFFDQYPKLEHWLGAHITAWHRREKNGLAANYPEVEIEGLPGKWHAIKSTLTDNGNLFLFKKENGEKYYFTIANLMQLKSVEEKADFEKSFREKLEEAYRATHEQPSTETTLSDTTKRLIGMLKKGGILKMSDGGNAARALELALMQELGTTDGEERDEFLLELGKYDRNWDDLGWSDFWRLASLVGDGFAVAGGELAWAGGAGSLIANGIADIIDPSITSGEALNNAAANVGWTAGSTLSGVGLAKLAKIGPRMAKYTPYLMSIILPLGAATYKGMSKEGLKEVQAVWDMFKNGNWSYDNVRAGGNLAVQAIGTLLSLKMGLKNARLANNKLPSGKSNIRTKNGDLRTVDDSFVEELLLTAANYKEANDKWIQYLKSKGYEGKEILDLPRKFWTKWSGKASIRTTPIMTEGTPTHNDWLGLGKPVLYTDSKWWNYKKKPASKPAKPSNYVEKLSNEPEPPHIVTAEPDVDFNIPAPEKPVDFIPGAGDEFAAYKLGGSLQFARTVIKAQGGVNSNRFNQLARLKELGLIQNGTPLNDNKIFLKLDWFGKIYDNPALAKYFLDPKYTERYDNDFWFALNLLSQGLSPGGEFSNLDFKTYKNDTSGLTAGFNDLFNKTGWNDVFGYDPTRNSWMGGATNGRWGLINYLMNTYNSSGNLFNNHYWDKDKKEWVFVDPNKDPNLEDPSNGQVLKILDSNPDEEILDYETSPINDYDLYEDYANLEGFDPHSDNTKLTGAKKNGNDRTRLTPSHSIIDSLPEVNMNDYLGALTAGMELETNSLAQAKLHAPNPHKLLKNKWHKVFKPDFRTTLNAMHLNATDAARRASDSNSLEMRNAIMSLAQKQNMETALQVDQATIANEQLQINAANEAANKIHLLNIDIADYNNASDEQAKYLQGLWDFDYIQNQGAVLRGPFELWRLDWVNNRAARESAQLQFAYEAYKRGDLDFKDYYKFANILHNKKWGKVYNPSIPFDKAGAKIKKDRMFELQSKNTLKFLLESTRLFYKNMRNKKK